jgi:hypothetical protein
MSSHLKKEFDERAVNRARNLITKNFNNRTMVGSGYEKVKQKHTEGETWLEDGRTWTIKNGVRQNVTKLDGAKKLAQTPLICPKCSGSMNHHLAKKMYKIHGFCFDCTIDMEAGLRRAGLYQEYEKQMMQGNMQGWAEGLQQWMIEQLGESISFVTEDGTVEDWGNNPARQKAEIIKNVNQYLDHLKKHLE